MVVKAEYNRSWKNTLERAIRIMRARLYALAKGLRTLSEIDPEAYKLYQSRFDEFCGIVEVNGETYQITGPSLKKLTGPQAADNIPSNADDEAAKE
jgi:hypothetical protein